MALQWVLAFLLFGFLGSGDMPFRLAVVAEAAALVLVCWGNGGRVVGRIADT